MVIAEAKQWHSVLVRMPDEGMIVECLAISFDEISAGYSRSRYQWYKGKWQSQAGSPKTGEGWIITHWLKNPDVYPPLPNGWPDCDIREVHDWLKPYLDERNRHETT